ncbi:MAG TPA: HAD family acid phosphatase [Nocardioides sp.]|nr:HAD family acid phosphatase [Nocardioides sp.]
MRTSGPTRTGVALAATTVAALVLGINTSADARVVNDDNLTPRTHFVMAADGSSGLTAGGAGIPNIDSVKSTIRAYYGASSAGVANKTTSPYISELAMIQADTLAGLPTVAPADHKAVVLDADDTTLWTYDMEDQAMHFNFDPALQNVWVTEKKFLATPGMVDFVDAVEAKGYAVFGLTGRSASQEDATVANLVEQGYTQFTADNFFTKFDSTHPKPDYLDCHTSVDPADDPAKCTTVEYKAGTRKHIQDTLGYDIVLNIGDQWSDLQGGFADDTLKLPNPTYYLPSPDIAGAPVSDSAMTPKTEFDMAADGSSGTTVGGESIPNIDSVKSTIRAYYGADSAGIANKTTSPYITEMTAFSQKWGKKLRTICERGVENGTKPAVVFDADDTTLWTYDMEDAAMKFNFDPTLQNVWVQEERFLPTPKMRHVVRAAAAGGCKIVGITGRNSTQRAATIDNLAKYYYDRNDNSLFKSQYYFTKWNSASGEQPPAYVDCAQDTDPVKCSTIEYKSSTRKHVEDTFGFHIIANFGDQFSDLKGGHSDRAVKLSNPTYYLP